MEANDLLQIYTHVTELQSLCETFPLGRFARSSDLT